MLLQTVSADISAYLQADEIIDADHPAIQAKAAMLRAGTRSPSDLARACFEFVRDGIAHSWDAQGGSVTLKASEVLETGFGYCFAKSHLLAALLRANGLPAGLCYQRLRLSPEESRFILHGLNAVLLPGYGWYRVDARGNKPGVEAGFNPPQEQLAFALNAPEERDFPFIFATPLPEVSNALRKHADIFALYADLPDLADLSASVGFPSSRKNDLMNSDFNIVPLSRELEPALRARIDSRTKPLGSLGRLEDIALQAGLIQKNLAPQLLGARIVVFAGDHGAARSGIGAYPQEVTIQMVQNFLNGGAAINVLARQAGLTLAIVDTGMASEMAGQGRPGIEYLVARQGAGTHNYLEEAAMSVGQRDAAIAKGADLVRGWRASGCNAIGFGEMGIGNSSAASLLTHFITGAPLVEIIGRGAGIDDAGLARKRTLLAQAAARVAGRPLSAMEALAEFGGFEIATMVGAFLAAAECGMLIVVDGFIVTSALLVAHAICPAVLDYCVFAHGSVEPGHRAQFAHFGVKPLLDLNMRVGEGTGAATAFPLIRAALACMNEMAGFEDAGVSAARAE